MFWFRRLRPPLTTFQRVDIELLMRRTIEIIGLELWHYQRNPVTNGVDEGWDNWCDESSNLQKIKLRVKAIDGRIVEEVEVIIGGD